MFLGICIVLILVCVALAISNVFLVFKDKPFNKRKYINENKKIFGTHNEGCSLDDHKTLHFYSSNDLGIDQ